MRFSVESKVSFRVEPGETIALIGPSGAGKSTVMNLLLGLDEAENGTVEIQGMPISSFSPSILHAYVAVVLQGPMLFAGTVEENIRMGRHDVSSKQVQEAAELANAHEFIARLPHGYRTEIGERGSTLSGGQAQRLAIARAVLGNPGLLLLDEATTSLDPKTERAVRIGLRQASERRTTLVITHQMTDLLEVDRILLLHSGRLVAEGTHLELLRNSPLYAQFQQPSLARPPLSGDSL